ncbi:RNA polymerase sigma factor [Thermodesulfobacteriota bacterium]
MSETKFSDIYQEFHPKVTHFLTRLVGGNEAEDVAQVVFEKVSNSLSDFKGESKLSTWIFKIATNAALDRLKSPSYKRTPSGPLAPVPLQTVENIEFFFNSPTSPDQKVIREEMSDCVREFVDRLPPDYRTIIILNELEGFTNKEIAEILQISLDAAKIRLHRARAQLKKSLESGCDFYLDGESELACDRKQPIDKDELF